MGCCPKVLALLVDYLENRLPPETRADLERHLAGCPDCVAYVRTYRSTVGLLRSLDEESLPPELRTRLKAFLDQRNRN